MELVEARRWVLKNLSRHITHRVQAQIVASALAEPLTVLMHRERPRKEASIQFTLRLPPALHQRCVTAAREKRMTLNKWILGQLTKE